MKPNSSHALGLANLIFYNNINLFTVNDDDIVKLNKVNGSII